MKEISKDFLLDELEEYKKDKASTIFRHALVKGSLNDVCTSEDDKVNVDFNFDLEIPTRSVTAQKMTGRCWIFAACNMIREKIANELDIAEFEVSQSYLAFYDKLEKCNFFMKRIEEVLDKNYDDRTFAFVLDGGLQDGGQWDMVVNIINKYGLLPKNAFPDTYNANNSAQYCSLINFNLKKFSYEAKQVYKEQGIEAVRVLEETYLKKIYRLLVSLYGIPPQEFTFEYTSKDGKCHKESFASPLAFKEKYLGNYLDEFISIVNLPSVTKPYNTLYVTDYQGNVIEGHKVSFLNIELSRFKELILKQLRDKQIVWFAADVSFYGNRVAGIWDDKAFDFKTATGLDYDFPKGEIFNYRASTISHAMCITGVSFDKEVPTKWKIENSWGKEVGNKGYFIMSGSWFDKFVYQAVVNKKYLSEAEIKAIKDNQVMLDPWDVLGN